MNIDAGVAVFFTLLVLYGAAGVLLGRASITMPMVFMIIGVVLGPSALNVLPIELESETVIQLTEITLALLLFADASTLDFNRLRHDAGLPLRLLGIGLPLTIALGGIISLIFFPGKGFWVCLSYRVHPRADGCRAGLAHLQQQKRPCSHPARIECGKRTE